MKLVLKLKTVSDLDVSLKPCFVFIFSLDAILLIRLSSSNAIKPQLNQMILAILVGWLFFYSQSTLGGSAQSVPSSNRSIKAIERNAPILSTLLEERGLELGAPIFIRIFKQEAELEVWLKGASGKFSLFKSYPICTFSGELGPKEKQGDHQSPEGFYFVKASQMNPWSQFHLSFNLGYPNRFDRAYARTGSALMVHGDCVSIGCYAMTDPGIEEIYTLAHSALLKGQPFFRVHAFPFRMTDQNMARYQKHKWFSFWQNLKTGYDWFENKLTPPNVEVANKSYTFSE